MNNKAIKKQLMSLEKNDGIKAIEVFKRVVVESIRFAECDPNHIFKEAFGLFNQQENAKTKKERKRIRKEFESKAGKLSKVLGLDTKHHLTEAVRDDFIPFAIEMCQSLEKEYEVQTPSEKALVQATVLAYCQMQECSRLFLSRLSPEYLSHEKAHYLSITSKGIDIAYRRFIQGIQMLKQIKMPPLKVNIKTGNAFLAQNQQINNSTTDHEINPLQ